ncbi:MAG: glycosyltransferase family 2 protein [Bacteroidales bacterium]|nr:glycosyltransferase family 2 protein [Bacteroidales bacterium]
MDRFDTCLKLLLPKVSVLFPECQVLVVANGHVRTEEQKKYIKDLEEFCTGFGNVSTVTFIDPRGLSFLWNTIIRKADHQAIMILNDDLRIRRKFRNFISSTAITEQPVSTINRSWSHFMISRPVVGVVGWFDENFPEIGGEDDDYLARLAMHGIMPADFRTDTIARTSKKRVRLPKINSYGRDMTEEYGGYSTLNAEYLFNKWETSDESFEGAVEVTGRKIRFWKLRG